MMQPWDAYLIYNALKLHFESDSYDAFFYNFKTSAKAKSFMQRKDKYSFAKLARKYPNREQLIDFFVANFVSSSGSRWVGEMATEHGDEIYLDWCRKRDAIYYYFQSDVDKLVEHCQANSLSFDDLFVPCPTHPLVVTLQIRQEISLETLILIDNLVGFMVRTNTTETIIWPEFSKRVRKYRSFLKWVDNRRTKKILLESFTSLQKSGTIHTATQTTQHT